VDIFIAFGGTPTTKKKLCRFAKIDGKNLQNFLDGLTYLRKLVDGNGKTAAVGFAGEAEWWDLAVSDPKITRGSCFITQTRKLKTPLKLKASLMLHYGGLGNRINAGISSHEAVLIAAKVDNQGILFTLM
jgi:carboxymethylenebutenolidase